MNPGSEQKKIAAILESGQFEWRGMVWQVDQEATKSHYLNANLAGKPLMKLVGVGAHGEVVQIWSHDVSTVDTPVAKVEVPEYVISDTGIAAMIESRVSSNDDGEPIKIEELYEPAPYEQPSKRGRKKTTLKKERL